VSLKGIVAKEKIELLQGPNVGDCGRGKTFDTRNKEYRLMEN
jgi:hypothetical protein